MKKKGLSTENLKAFNMEEYKETQYDILAQEVRKALDIDYIYKIMGIIRWKNENWKDKTRGNRKT